MVKRGVLGLWWAGFVEPFVFAVALAIDAVDEKINPIDEKPSIKPWTDEALR